MFVFRKLISKVRSILDTESTTNRASGPDSGRSKTEDINSRTGIRHFEAFLKSIGRTDSLLDARRLKNDITNEIRKTRLTLANHENEEWINGEKTEAIVAYLDRLYTAKKKVDKRIASLGGADDSVSNIFPREMFFLIFFQRQSAVIETPGGPKHKHTLRDVLSNPSSLSYFMEFMDRRGRSIMVQFWLHVESFKNPLESVESGEESGDEGALRAPGINSVSDTVKDDMLGIYEMYFANLSPNSVLAKVVSRKHINSIRTFAQELDQPTVLQERRVRRSVLLTQRQVEKEMEEDFGDFERSDLWFRAVGDMEPNKGATSPSQHRQATPPGVASPVEASSPTSILRPVARPGLHPTFTIPAPGIHRTETAPAKLSASLGLDSVALSSQPPPSKVPTNLDLLFGAEDTMAEDDRIPLFAEKPTTEEEEQTQRMEAIQAALTDIIADERRYSERPLSGISSDGALSRNVTNERVHGDDEYERPGKRKRVFDDEPEEEENDAQEEQEDENGRGTTFFEPALPGDLQLSYDIAKLTEKILKLQSQEVILDTLIRKAELTGDAQELRLLNKSKSAMGRELRALTFQRAQYEEQEALNRLVPDRTRVAIRSSTTAEEEGKSVVRYLIEVQQLAVDGTFASGWVVARRYNEFFNMHQRLKEKYTAVKSLEFPGKRLVTSMSSSFVDTRRIGLEKYMQVRSRTARKGVKFMSLIEFDWHPACMRERGTTRFSLAKVPDGCCSARRTSQDICFLGWRDCPCHVPVCDRKHRRHILWSVHARRDDPEAQYTSRRVRWHCRVWLT